MKKLLLGITAAAAILTTQASASMFSEYGYQHIGPTYVSVDSIDGYGVTYGAGLDIPVFKNKVQGVTLGGEFNVDFFGLDSDNEYDFSSFAYGGDIQLTAGYSFNDKFKVPVQLKVGVGYNYLNLNSDVYTYGVEYRVSADYSFTDKFSAEVSYRATPGATLSINGYTAPDVDTSVTGLYFNWKI